MDSLWHDIRLAARLLVRERGFTLAAVSALALGISANTTVFTAVNASLLRDLPFDNADRILSLGTRDATARHVLGPRGYRGVSFPEFEDWKAATATLTDIAAYVQSTMNVGDEEHAPEKLTGAYVSANAFHVIGRRPVLGRGFVADDDRPGADAVVILGDVVWRSRYGGDSTVLGRTIRINGIPSTIIGIMPAGFQFPSNADIWQPMTVYASGLAVESQGATISLRTRQRLDLIGRLREGATIEQARSELATIGQRLARDFPDTNADIVPTVTPFADRYLAPQVKFVFAALMGAVGLVLLIACANVANLLLARSAGRASEVSIRVSLGATRWRIIRQLLIESLLVAMLGGVIGFGLSLLGLRLFRAMIASLGAPPYWIDFTMDSRVFLFLAAICLGTGILFGLAPALHLSRTNVNTLLKEGARTGAGNVRSRRWAGAFVVSQLSLTLVLLAGAGYFGRSFLEVYRFHPGFKTSGLIRMALVLPRTEYPTVEARAAFAEQLDARLRSTPGMVVSLTSSPPFGGGDRFDLAIEGQTLEPDRARPNVLVKTVGADYFKTLQLSLLRGQSFSESDGRDAAIVSERLATMFFGSANPIGARIRVSRPDGPPDAGRWMTVIGVSPNLNQRNATVPEPLVYLPFSGDALLFSNLYVLARSDREVGATLSRVRDELRAIDEDLPLCDVSTVDEWLAFLRSPERVFSTMFAVFACMALLLASVGLYAVVAHAVAQRTHEIGIRMALGAGAASIHWLVMRRALVHLSIGLLLGLAGALAVGRLIHGMFATGNDPTALIAVTALLTIVAITACLWPARRATRFHPAVALRHE